MTNEQMPLAAFPFRDEPMVYISDALAAIEAATLKATQTERNFCERCGKRLGDSEHIHTCTPPIGTQGENT